MLKIRILSENYARRRYMTAEHGLSIWVEADDRNILFDTGQSDIFLHNAKQMGIDLTKADMLVLSHGTMIIQEGFPHFAG
jgi:7,8-dihydropterin-6-yl-methyl-4-(beta-D-ribofuranosyl)aminobenzene 5'-phosphate synthase